MTRAEALTGAHDSRQHLLRRHCGVPQLGRRQAGVAVAAVAGLFVEVRQQQPTPTGRGLGIAEHRVELHLVDALVLGRAVGAHDERPLLHDVGEAVRHPRDCRIAVATRATGLLVVALEALGQVDVSDEAYVGLVDAHAERDGRHHDHAVFATEALLHPGTLVARQTSVVGECVISLLPQHLCDLVSALARLAVDDARSAREARTVVARLEEPQQLRSRVGLLLDDIADVGAVEGGDVFLRLAEPEPVVDLAPRDRVGGRGERDARHPREVLSDIGDAEVFRSEVVAPLRHAVRLVDREECDAGAVGRVVEKREERRHQQPLRCDIEQVETSGHQLAAEGGGLLGARRGVPERRRHTEQVQRLDLVVHERDERRHHDADTGTHQRRQLIAQRLAATGRHEHDGVGPRDRTVDDRLLRPAERGEPEHLPQHPDSRPRLPCRDDDPRLHLTRRQRRPARTV